MGSTLVLCGNIGMCLAFILGHFCNYYTTPKVVIALTVLFAIGFFFFPESPIFLLKQNKNDVSNAKKKMFKKYAHVFLFTYVGNEKIAAILSKFTEKRKNSSNKNR